ncbi:hypothetical protein [Burkholderia cenocepacia]|uniref:hypothetical protein n=1 Tax=Burkholderia cenocepacia TaxID=95486 RepID=UPI0022390941|nr:hypothetical protein [Burkholderia cenocepacia]MCW5156323.1 hypothetical protein [Burkholderia cenocepacia]
MKKAATLFQPVEKLQNRIAHIERQIAISNNARFAKDMEPTLAELKSELALQELIASKFVLAEKNKNK